MRKKFTDLVNLETITAYENRDEIVKMAKNNINGLVGREIFLKVLVLEEKVYTAMK